MNAPVEFSWNGDAMVPLRHFVRRCDQQFAVGETYPMVVHEDRSTTSHNHFFAAVHEAWKNLPERLTARYPTSDHLRKWSLIKAGYADERSIVCPTADEALRVAAFIKPMDDFSVVVVADATIKVFTAKSQSVRAMGKQQFQESKQAVLDIVAGIIGVDVATLQANTNSSPALSGAATEPASAETNRQASAGAGEPKSSSVPAEHVAGGEERQVGTPSNPAQNGAPGLPEKFQLQPGWERSYAAALAKAGEPSNLPKRAVEWWSDKGGWVAHKNGPDASTAQGIYDAYANHPGEDGRESREVILNELNAI